MNDSDRFHAAIARIDAANAEDPNRESVDGQPQPKELIYGRRMSQWLERLRPDAPEPLRLAARSQHIQRWKIPRRDYPLDRPGYKRWRTDLGKFHAEATGRILREVGYDEATIERVQSLLRKENLKRDPDAQTLEDAAALVFLQYYSAAFAEGQDDDKLVMILRKTWNKMSPQGHAAAMGLELPPRLKALVGRALEA